ncbi:MAG: P-II family nitrogen regulator [Treponema sp.]|jgi:nitrogen regulatory protein PII|nr:P-II family nitrogen regulator [Treponema sp.]
MSKEKSRRSFRLPFKLPIFRGETRAQPSKAPPVLKLAFFIVDWNKVQILSDVFEEEKVRFHFITKARGTAGSDVLDLLGLGAGDKAVVICLEQEVLVPVLLREVRKKLGRRSRGAGIAFTLPLSGINTPLLRVFKESIHQNEKITSEQKGVSPMTLENQAERIRNDLILAIINQGYSDEFMTAAREAGASGGTVINARGLAHEGPVKFFGVSVQDEKEIIIMLTSREKKIPIMQAVSKACGIASNAEGLIFSLPVDSVLGLNLE